MLLLLTNFLKIDRNTVFSPYMFSFCLVILKLSYYYVLYLKKGINKKIKL